MGVATPPNTVSHPPGHSSAPVAPIAGRGAAPSNETNRFEVGESKMPQPPSAVELGKGAIPVMPWDSNGVPAGIRGTMPDDAVLRRGK